MLGQDTFFVQACSGWLNSWVVDVNIGVWNKSNNENSTEEKFMLMKGLLLKEMSTEDQ